MGAIPQCERILTAEFGRLTLMQTTWRQGDEEEESWEVQYGLVVIMSDKRQDIAEAAYQACTRLLQIEFDRNY